MKREPKIQKPDFTLFYVGIGLYLVLNFFELPIFITAIISIVVGLYGIYLGFKYYEYKTGKKLKIIGIKNENSK